MTDPHHPSATRRISRWLALGAAPTFAAMAVLTGADAASMPGMAMPEPSLLTGMAPMYALMSLFHIRPWLKLVTRASHSQRQARCPEGS